MKKNATTEFFEKHAGSYDGFQSAVVPRYDECISMIAEAYRHYIGSGVFLDLGCGSGNLSLNILKKSSRSQVFLVDGSSAMLELALQKVKAQAGEQAIPGSKVARLGKNNWHCGIERPYDAVVSAFVLEHLQETNYKAVIRCNYDLLRSGGVFLSVEWSDDEYGMQEWFKKEMHQRGKDCPQYTPYIEDSEKMERHYFVNIREKMTWLKDAGYQDVHTIWQHLFGYIVVCKKP
jgi:tRNA (cmo5U34)-methyltransferase